MKTLVEDKARGVAIEAMVEGEGPDVVLLASNLRGAADFARLQSDLSSAGFRSIALNMRGVGASAGPDGAFTLADIADDIAGVISQLCPSPAHIVGHALGNILARATASFRPEVVRSVTVMPCGGHNLGAYPVSEHVLRHFPRCHDRQLSAAERCESLGIAFFAPGNDPSVWLDGWWPQATAVGSAALGADPEMWWRAGAAPILVIQPLNDAMSPREAGIASATGFGERASYVEVANCGHAILPEQPERIAEVIIAFLRAQA